MGIVRVTIQTKSFHKGCRRSAIFRKQHIGRTREILFRILYICYDLARAFGLYEIINAFYLAGRQLLCGFQLPVRFLDSGQLYRLRRPYPRLTDNILDVGL